jgi:hypothetical protein
VREVRVSPAIGSAKARRSSLTATIRRRRRAARSAALARTAAAAELQAAEAGLALARASHNRIAGLQARRSATAQELDDATATLRGAEARVAGASARVLQAASAVESARGASGQASTTESFTRVAAPFDGMVTEKMTAETWRHQARPSPLEDTADSASRSADESRIGQIRTRTASRSSSGPDHPIEGTVVEVSRAVDADARAFLVKIALPDAPGLRSGEFGKARFGGTPRRALTIPSSAIVRRGQLTSVFVVDKGVARVRLVNLSESEVLAGLTESEVVILSPPAGVTDGRSRQRGRPRWPGLRGRRPDGRGVHPLQTDAALHPGLDGARRPGGGGAAARRGAADHRAAG